MSAEPELVWARRVKGWACEEPGVTVPGAPPVMMPPTTSSPAPTASGGARIDSRAVPLGRRHLVEGAGRGHAAVLGDGTLEKRWTACRDRDGQTPRGRCSEFCQA